MKAKDIIKYRLHNQHITTTSFTKPEQIVSHLLAVQAQDWPMAKWALGLRIPGSKESDILDSFNGGKILRTHTMRPTWHFVSPEDIQWLLQLTSPRVQKLNALYYRKFNLDTKVFSKAMNVMQSALHNHHYLTRDEIKAKLAQVGIEASLIRLAYIIMYAELEGLICSGPRKGKQFTYALIEEKVKNSKTRSNEEALFELVARYLKTRGPATVNDMSWWSGLTIADVKKGIQLLQDELGTFDLEGREYFYYPSSLDSKPKKPVTFLVPDYDEYGIGYKDRSIYQKPDFGSSKRKHDPVYKHAICVDGFFRGLWKREVKGNKVHIETKLDRSVTKTQEEAVRRARKQYLAFFESQE